MPLWLRQIVDEASALNRTLCPRSPLSSDEGPELTSRQAIDTVKLVLSLLYAKLRAAPPSRERDAVLASYRFHHWMRHRNVAAVRNGDVTAIRIPVMVGRSGPRKNPLGGLTMTEKNSLDALIGQIFTGMPESELLRRVALLVVWKAVTAADSRLAETEATIEELLARVKALAARPPARALTEHERAALDWWKGGGLSELMDRKVESNTELLLDQFRDVGRNEHDRDVLGSAVIVLKSKRRPLSPEESARLEELHQRMLEHERAAETGRNMRRRRQKAADTRAAWGTTAERIAAVQRFFDGKGEPQLVAGTTKTCLVSKAARKCRVSVSFVWKHLQKHDLSFPGAP